MSNEEIKTLIEQEAEKHVISKLAKFTEEGIGLSDLECEDIKEDYTAGATFYEQSILPEVLKEKEEEIKRWQEAHKNVTEYYNKLVESLQSQLSQLQSKMEEEKRKVKEDLIWQMINDWQDARSIGEDLDTPKFSFNDIEHELYQYLEQSTTQSTESGNLNKQ